MLRMIFLAPILGMLCILAGEADARSYPAGQDQDLAGETGPSPVHMIQPRSRPPETPAQRPGTIDSDRDGEISLAEANAHYSWLFNLLDQDHDGAIRKVEFVGTLELNKPDPAQRQAHRHRLGELFARLDGDGDAVILEGEFLAACDSHFSSSDADGDGRVSVWEFRSRRAL